MNEEQGAQSHFLDLCELLAVPKPGSEAGYLFEEKNSVIGGRTGYADVFRRGAFALGLILNRLIAIGMSELKIFRRGRTAVLNSLDMVI